MRIELMTAETKTANIWRHLRVELLGPIGDLVETQKKLGFHHQVSAGFNI